MSPVPERIPGWSSPIGWTISVDSEMRPRASARGGPWKPGGPVQILAFQVLRMGECEWRVIYAAKHWPCQADSGSANRGWWVAVDNSENSAHPWPQAPASGLGQDLRERAAGLRPCDLVRPRGTRPRPYLQGAPRRSRHRHRHQTRHQALARLRARPSGCRPSLRPSESSTATPEPPR